MLDRYYLRPETTDRVSASWIADAIKQYVAWMTEREYRPSTVRSRVPLVFRFGEFARSQGAMSIDELPSHVDAFVEARTRRRLRRQKSAAGRRLVIREVRGPVDQMLRLALPGHPRALRARPGLPFEAEVPGFFLYLRSERGLRPPTIKGYTHHLRRFHGYLQGLAIDDLQAVSPPVISGFITTRATKLTAKSMKPLCSALRIFLGYCFREQIIQRDLSPVVEPPQAYRLAHLPRSISWDDVRRMLDAVDRRSALGKRDYALLLLMVTYGLRARELARLTLNDINWKAERLRVPERKAGHSSAFPLSPIVGAALIDYLKHGRAATTDRRVFQKLIAPPGPMTYSAIASRATRCLKKAGIQVRRPGSHTLRHTCVQRLVDADFSLKQIGDYVGHGSPSSTEIYSKVDVERLREVALGAEEGLP